MFKDLLTPEQRAKLERDQAYRAQQLEWIRGMGTQELIGTIIHALHNCGPVMGGAIVEHEDYFVQGYGEKVPCTVPVFKRQSTWGKYDPVYDAQLRYLYTPEVVVRLWCVDSLLRFDPTGTEDIRSHFPTKCPVCQADIREIFQEFTK